MNGWLVVNSFLRNEKLDKMYALFLSSAKDLGIDLALLRGCEISDVLGGGFQKRPLPDFVIFWDKDTILAQMLENAGVRVFNSSRSIDVCDSKAKTYLQLSEHGIPIPQTIIAPKTFEGIGHCDPSFLQMVIGRLKLPMIIKESFGSFGQQVYLANTESEVRNIVDRIGHKDFLFQEFIATSRGRDVRINVVGQQVVASMLRYHDTDFRSNLSNGGQAKNYAPTEAQKQLALSAVSALKLDHAGVDILFGADDAPVICEVNSNPHFLSVLEYTGVHLSDHIIRHIRDEMK